MIKKQKLRNTNQFKKKNKSKIKQNMNVKSIISYSTKTSEMGENPNASIMNNLTQTSEMGENPNASIMNNLSTLKSKKMKNKLNQPVSIINNTVNDFRSNLKKYYLTYGDNQLYVKPKNGQSFGINFSELSSLTDLYNKMKGFGSPTIVPKVILKKDFKEFMIDTNQIFSFNGYFDNDENFEIIESTKEYLEKCNPNWIGIDNQIYREFFYLTLGEYSGYSK